MRPDVPYGRGTRMLTLAELCEWLNITERHARKLVARREVPYRKVGLLRFPEAEVEEWTHPRPQNRPAGPAARSDDHPPASVPAMPRRPRCVLVLPKSLIEQEDEHVTRRSA